MPESNIDLETPDGQGSGISADQAIAMARERNKFCSCVIPNDAIPVVNAVSNFVVTFKIPRKPGPPQLVGSGYYAIVMIDVETGKVTQCFRPRG